MHYLHACCHTCMRCYYCLAWHPTQKLATHSSSLGLMHAWQGSLKLPDDCLSQIEECWD